MSMKVGLVLNSQFPMEQDPATRVSELVEQVRCARDAGFHAIWGSHHYLAEPFQMLQPWSLLGRVASEAGGMWLGTNIFLLTLANPVYAAEQVATIDAISGGRFIFGVGLGFRDEEFQAFGIDPRRRVSRFEECLDVALRLWTEESVDHHGTHFELDGARLGIRCVQQPHPPVWMAGNADAAVRRAARYGAPWLVNPHADLPTIRRQMTLYHEGREAHGKPDPREVPLFREVAIARTREEAMRVEGPHLGRKYAGYAKWGLVESAPAQGSDGIDLDAFAPDRFIIGDPDTCLEEIKRYEEVAGATHLLARMDWSGLAQRDVLAQISMLGEHVIPRL